MRFSRTAPAVLIAATLLAIAVVSVVSSLIARQMTSSFEEAQFRLMARVADASLRNAQQQATSNAELIAALPPVRKAFAARVKEDLLAVTRDAFLLQQNKYGLSQAHFHLPDNISYLRVHNPARSGDDLAKYRPIVVEVNSAKALRQGIEITTSGVGIFGTVPMKDAEGGHVGSFEAAVEFGPVLDRLKKDYGFELAVFIDEKMLRETATSLSGDVLNEANRAGRFIRFHSTHGELMRLAVTGDDVGVVETANYLRDIGGVPHGVVLQPVYNYAKRQIGVLAIAQDFSLMRSGGGRAVLWQVLLGIISAVALIGVIVVTLRGLLLHPLGTLNVRLRSLAAGEAAEPLPEDVKYAGELGELADSYDRLRRQSAAAEPAA